MTAYLDTGINSPDIAVEIDFDTDPVDTPRQWTDVTRFVRQIQWQRGGRAHELQTTEAGTLTAVLDNTDARFDPTNTGGSYYPHVKRMRWIRVRGKWATTEYPRWQGLIESWGQDWPAAGKDATCTIRAVDAFKILSLFDLVGKSYPEETTGDRLGQVCVDADVPTVTLPNGLTTIPAVGPFAAGSSALSHLQQVIEAENGLMFADASGEIVFQDRHHRLTAVTATTSQGTIGDVTGGAVFELEEYGGGIFLLEDGGGRLLTEESVGEIPYRDAQFNYDDTDVWPTVTVTPAGGTAQTYGDADSYLMHFNRVLQRSSLCESEGEALSAAQYLSARYANPAPRIPSLEIIGQVDTANWPAILSMDLSQRFTFTRRAYTTISQDVMIEGISEQVVPGSGWRVFLQLSPASSSSYWVLGDALLGELDDTTVLAY